MSAHGPSWVEVGRIDRAHGLSGEVVLRLISNDLGRLDPGSVLWLDGGGELTVRRARPHKHRWVVTFAEIDDREAADAMRGQTLLGEAVRDDPDSYWVHDLIGAAVVDPAGVAHGRVLEVMDNPASDVLVLSTGALVPLRFASWDGDGRLVVDGPAGLLDG